MPDISSILNFIKKSTIFDIFLVSFIALPFVFQAWTAVLKEVGYSSLQVGYGLCLVTVAYACIIIFMIIDTKSRQKKEIARDQLLGYLQSKNITMMRFDTVREKINKNYEDDFIYSVISAFPSDLRRAKLHDNKLGVARIIEEAEDQEDLALKKRVANK